MLEQHSQTPQTRAEYQRAWAAAKRARQHERAPSEAPTFTAGMHRGTDVGVRPGDQDWYLGGTHPPGHGSTFIPSDRDPAYPETYRSRSGLPAPSREQLAKERAAGARLKAGGVFGALAGPRWEGCVMAKGRYVVPESSKAPPLAEQLAEQAGRRLSTNTPRRQALN
jgi:hypothetical protein